MSNIRQTRLCSTSDKSFSITLLIKWLLCHFLMYVTPHLIFVKSTTDSVRGNKYVLLRNFRANNKIAHSGGKLYILQENIHLGENIVYLVIKLYIFAKLSQQLCLPQEKDKKKGHDTNARINHRCIV